ncbi:hypothetical protein D3C72_1836250 [compost metagenome]
MQTETPPTPVTPAGDRPASPAKLTTSEVVAIREACRNGEAPAAIAARLGMLDTHVRSVITGRRWSHVPGAIPCLRGRRYNTPST